MRCNLLVYYLNRNLSLSSLVVILIFSLAILIYQAIHHAFMPCGELGDCVKYLKMAHSFATTNFQSIESPFNLRILSPWLASHNPRNFNIGFMLVNCISELIFVLCWFGIACKLNFNNFKLFILIAWFFLHPIGFSIYSFMPAMVDPIAYGLLSLVTLLFLYKRRFLLMLALFLGLLAKESFLFVLMLVVFSELIYMIRVKDKREKIITITSIFSLLLLFLLYKLVIVWMQHHLFPPYGQYGVSIIDTVRFWMGQALQDSERFVVWLGSFLCVTGLFSVFLLDFTLSFKNPEQERYLVYFVLGSIGFILLGLLAGSDMTRIIFNGNLLIFSLFFMSQNKCNFNKCLLTFLLSIIIALNYTILLPSAYFEYNYYNSHSIRKIVFFIFIDVLAIIFIIVTSKIIDKIKNKRNFVTARALEDRRPTASTAGSGF